MLAYDTMLDARCAWFDWLMIDGMCCSMLVQDLNAFWLVPQWQMTCDQRFVV